MKALKIALASGGLGDQQAFGSTISGTSVFEEPQSARQLSERLGKVF